MNNLTQKPVDGNPLVSRINRIVAQVKELKWFGNDDKVHHPFWVIVYKEVSDHIRSWRFIILCGIIVLTCMGSMYTALSSIGQAAKPNESVGSFFFLKLFTASDGTLPSFFIFISFLGPLLGISLGFDAVNSEQNRGTLSRVLAQPIHRDYVINAKFIGALIVISVMLFALGFLVIGLGLFMIGIPPSAEEFLRMVFFMMLSIIYVAFWLNLSIFFSVRFRQPATAALAGIAIWLFLTVFYPMIVDLIVNALKPSGGMLSNAQLFHLERLKIGLMRVMPSQLFTDATITLLVPTVKSLGPLMMEQTFGAIPNSPLPLGQSVLLVWPQITGLLAATVLCFVLSYVPFMRREIRSR